MTMINVITAELVGAALDWAVAKSDCFPVQYSKRLGVHLQKTMDVSEETRYLRMGSRYCPSTDWSQGGPLIEKYKLHLHCDEPSASFIQQGMRIGYTASTVLIAACRAIVACKLGATVSVPAELLTSSMH